MRSRLLPLPLLAATLALTLAPARAGADDGANLRRNYDAPIAGTPLPGWTAPELKTPVRPAKSPALVIAGIIAGGLGAVGAVTGVVLMNTGSQGCDAGLCTTKTRDLGLTVAFGGAGVAAAGLVMMLVGLQPADAAPAAAARFVPQVAVGPTGGALTWRF
jgi:hypothetical protein